MTEQEFKNLKVNDIIYNFTHSDLYANRVEKVLHKNDKFYIVLDNGNESDVDKELYINIIHDEYTIIKKLDLVYYRKPKRFDVIGVDSLTVFDECELPENVHMEIVEGAVEMFITEAKYRLNMNQNNNK